MQHCVGAALRTPLSHLHTAERALRGVGRGTAWGSVPPTPGRGRGGTDTWSVSNIPVDMAALGTNPISKWIFPTVEYFTSHFLNEKKKPSEK